MSEPKLIMVGMLTSSKFDKQKDICRRVYDPDGIAPTLNTFGGGQRESKVIEYENLQTSH